LLVRVLELGRGVASAYAAKLLGDHGADVIKVEPPEGDALRRCGPWPANQPDPAQSGLYLALNLNKRGVSVADDEVETFERLIAWADVVVHDFSSLEARARGVDRETFANTSSHLVTLAITAFGQTGPYAEYQAEDLTLTNAGGWANLCPATHTDPSLPPLKVCGDQCALMAAIGGAMTALAFAREAQRSGAGEYIDFSIQAYVASVLELGVPAYSYRSEVITRYHERSLIPWRIFQAKDRPVYLVCVEQDQWERLMVFMGDPSWAGLDVFADQASRAENQDLVHTFVQEFVSEWTANDLYHAAQKHRICVAPVLNQSEIAANEHLRERDFFTWVARDGSVPVQFPGSSILTTSGRAPVSRGAPALGEHNADLSHLPEVCVRSSASDSTRLPLKGVRVLDMTWAWAGPFATMNLAFLGADVIRIESEKRADLYRRFPVYPDDVEPTLNVSGMFNQWNQGKSSITIDFATSEGLALVKRLVAVSDVVVQNYATGVMERLGLGYDALREINPGIIMASVSGYGQTGPYREYMGYGPAIPPLTGLAAGTGYVNGAPEEIGLSMPDPTAGITTALGVIAALCRRDATGEGDHLDVSLWEATAVLNVEAWMDFVFNGAEPVRMGNRHPRMAPHGCYPCAGDDAWISIACRNDEQWKALAALVGHGLDGDSRLATLAGRKRIEDELDAQITGWTSERDRWAITKELQALGIAAFPTLSTQDIVEDEQLNSRKFIERLDHPEVGKRAHAGIPWRLTRRRNGVSRPAPCIDADTDRHLQEILGLTTEQIAGLRERTIIGI
jgi:crotonobetainyl-CoA:carnitine CoA-transferase CaiB-like acyl-CoA transferase